jgi:hypothetical protein
MIYAMLRQNLPAANRRAIARAILAHDQQATRRHVLRGHIVHVMRVGIISSLFCIYCRNRIHPSHRRSPRGRFAQSAWHFEHDLPVRCIGQILPPLMPHAIGVLNPRRHGCYVALGCEAANGQPTNQDRRMCRTILGGRTYCHMAVSSSASSLRAETEAIWLSSASVGRRGP